MSTTEKQKPGASVPAQAPAAEGTLVVVSPEVVETADHVLGNLFQRLYHGIERVRRVDTDVAATLAEATSQVEEALQLVLDYITAGEPRTTRIPAPEWVESVVRNLAPSAVPMLVALVAPLDGASVVCDLARISRATELLRVQLTESLEGVRVTTATRDRMVHVSLRFPPGGERPHSSLGELRWSVAQRLVEMHGGALARQPGAAGECEWTISLPTQL